MKPFDFRAAARPTEPAPIASPLDEIQLLTILKRSGLVLAAKLDVRSVAQALVDLATSASRAQSGAVFYRGSPSHSEFSCLARAGAPGAASANPARASEGSVVRGDDLAAIPAGCLAMPLTLHAGVVAHLILEPPPGERFPGHAQRVVAGIVEQAAIALENARIYEETKRVSEQRARELDEARAARAQLIADAATRDDALGDLAHTLRGPLNSILGWANVLLAHLPDDSAHRNGIEIIARNARAQAEMIETLVEGNRRPPTPVRRTAETPSVRPSTASDLPPVSLNGVRILVVDDDRDARDLVSQILTAAKADVITAASASEALAVLRTTQPNVIVSDIGMSMSDGYQFIRTVRSLSPDEGNQTPALALTGFVQSKDRIRALLAGFQDHIAKPVEARDLIVAVQRLASR